MTHCTGAPAELWLERYIQGTLPDDEAQQFEEHYFDCPVCLSRVEALQAVRARLGDFSASGSTMEKPPGSRLPPSPSSTRSRATLLSWPKVAAALLALAAALLIVTLGERFLLPHFLPPNVTIQAGPQSPPTLKPPAIRAQSSVAQLADLTLPPFRAANLRGEGENADFTSAMRAYSAGDCRAALTALSRVHVSSKGDNTRAAEFYSGVCQMHLGSLSDASTTLQRVASAGDSPQQEAAFYYLAQIALLRNDAPSARQALNLTMALHGDFEQRARRQFAALAEAGKQ